MKVNGSILSLQTTEAELRQFFSTFGAIKDCKIITDRAGVSKGCVWWQFEVWPRGAAPQL